MSYLLLLGWPLIMAASCWLLRRTQALATALAALTTAVVIIAALRTPLADPARLLGTSVILSGSGQVGLVVIAGGVLLSILLNYVLTQGEQTPALALVLLGCAAGLVLFNTPVLAVVWTLLAGVVLVVAMLDQPAGGGLVAPATLGTALKFLLMMMLGVALVLVGVLLETAYPTNRLSAGLMLVGWLVLLGVVPFQLTLGDVVADTPLPTALLLTAAWHPLVALLMIGTLQPQLQVLAAPLALALLRVAGALSWLAGGLALRGSLRRRIVWLLTAQLGWLALAQPDAPASLAFLVRYVVAAALLLGSAGLLERRVAGRTELAGLLRERPLAATALIVGLLVALGVPPLLGVVPLLMALPTLGDARLLAVLGLGLALNAWAAAALIRDLLLRPAPRTDPRPQRYDEVNLLPAAVPLYAPAVLRAVLLALMFISLVGGLAPSWLIAGLRLLGGAE